jgi:uncharacterized Zn finger protein
MCKHIAAVLYGVGTRLDQQPELLFKLRRVDAKDLVHQAGAGLPSSAAGVVSGKVLDDAVLSDVFGIEMDNDAPPQKPVAKKKAAPAKKVVAAKTTAATKGVKKSTAVKATTKTPLASAPTAKTAKAVKTVKTVKTVKAVKAVKAKTVKVKNDHG